MEFPALPYSENTDGKMSLIRSFSSSVTDLIIVLAPNRQPSWRKSHFVGKNFSEQDQ